MKVVGLTKFSNMSLRNLLDYLCALPFKTKKLAIRCSRTDDCFNLKLSNELSTQHQEQDLRNDDLEDQGDWKNLSEAEHRDAVFGSI